MNHEYRVLIVDDETFIVDWVAGLLESEEAIGPALDIVRAYSADEALRWFARTRIDLLISDIRMPGLSGLELAVRVKQEWPACRLLFLTAHAQFDYAYQALQLGIDGYLLKNEEDRDILLKIRQVIERQGTDALPAAAPPFSRNRRAFFALLFGAEQAPEQIDQLLAANGFAKREARYCLLLFPQALSEQTRAQVFLAIADILQASCLDVNETREYWLLELSGLDEHQIVRLKGRLEWAQQRAQETFDCLVSPSLTKGQITRATSAGAAMADMLAESSGLLMSFSLKLEKNRTVDDRTIQFIRKHVREHIAGDVSLTRLSELTGYNASYLSRYFSETTGETLSHYIAQVRLETIRGLLSDSNLGLQEVCVKAGFSSRTYFNRFVRQNTGQSPQQYMDAVRKR